MSGANGDRSPLGYREGRIAGGKDRGVIDGRKDYVRRLAAAAAIAIIDINGKAGGDFIAAIYESNVARQDVCSGERIGSRSIHLKLIPGSQAVHGEGELAVVCRLCVHGVQDIGCYQQGFPLSNSELVGDKFWGVVLVCDSDVVSDGANAAVSIGYL